MHVVLGYNAKDEIFGPTLEFPTNHTFEISLDAAQFCACEESILFLLLVVNLMPIFRNSSKLNQK
jgi:hypothetical protein